MMETFTCVLLATVSSSGVPNLLVSYWLRGDFIFILVATKISPHEKPRTKIFLEMKRNKNFGEFALRMNFVAPNFEVPPEI